MPEHIRYSKVLTGNDLGLLGNVETLPDQASIDAIKDRQEVKAALLQGEEALHRLAHQYLEAENVSDAWKVLLAGEL